jgi:hypothetical protein
MATSARKPIVVSGVAIVIGIVLATISIFTLTSALSPSAQQSDSDLLVYGDEGS